MINHIHGLSGMYFTVKLFSGGIQTGLQTDVCK